MKSLGYSSTWATTCFIDGGCGARVFAHTNGRGDFVLFDELGWPWPVHDCYLNRYCSRPVEWKPEKSPGVLSASLSSLLSAARHSKPYEGDRQQVLHAVAPAAKRSAEITRIAPHVGMSSRTFTVVGYVADIHEQYRPRALRALGTLGEQLVAKVIGARHSQITVVNSKLESYTALADLRREAVAKGDSVSVDLCVGSVLNIPVFLCDRVERLRIQRVAARSITAKGVRH